MPLLHDQLRDTLNWLENHILNYSVWSILLSLLPLRPNPRQGEEIRLYSGYRCALLVSMRRLPLQTTTEKIPLILHWKQKNRHTCLPQYIKHNRKALCCGHLSDNLNQTWIKCQAREVQWPFNVPLVFIYCCPRHKEQRDPACLIGRHRCIMVLHLSFCLWNLRYP